MREQRGVCGGQEKQQVGDELLRDGSGFNECKKLEVRGSNQRARAMLYRRRAGAKTSIQGRGKARWGR